MAMKKLRRDVGGETWAQFQRGCRKYHVKFWKKTCPWVCRPRLCAKAFHFMKKNKSLKECLLLDCRYSSRFPEQKHWQ